MHTTRAPHTCGIERLRRPGLPAGLAVALTMLLAVALAGCAALAPDRQAVRLDDRARIAVISAFAPELDVLRAQLQQVVEHQVAGVTFSTGMLAGKPVVLLLSGVSMTNAAMNTQRVLDWFKVSHIVFSGIAGGVNPALHIGDVSVPAQWGQYMEWLMAREEPPGQYHAPAWMKDELMPLPAFGMMHPRSVELRSAADPAGRRQFWFAVDAGMLALARSLQNIDLAHCHAGHCLQQRPRVVVGGNGVSGPAFVDNKAFREYTFKTFAAHVLDMETAATAMVAEANGVPFIAFRSLSDLAGGGEGDNEMATFMQLAAANSAKVLLAFLAAWQ